MKTISYRFQLLLIYITTLVIVSLLLYNLFSTFRSTSVGTISKENFKNKSLEREAYLHDFFYPYITTLQATQQSEILKQYLSGDISQETIENYFLDIKKSLPCLTQVRFIDNSGMEKARIDGTPISLMKEKAVSQIIPQSKLQNKSQRDYVKKFVSLKKEEIGLSKIDLNKEYQRVTNPKQPTLRLGMSVYDNLDEKQGFLVFNICLRTFFKLLNKTTLYYVHLIDDKGNFISHHQAEYGLLGEDSHHNIFEQYPDDAQRILINDEYFGINFYSLKLKNFDTGQNIKLILELKFHNELEETKKVKDDFLIFTFVIAFVFFLIALYFAKLPDLLKKKAEKEKLLSKLTGLPNRLALMEDLANKKFKKSLIILISANNILKIQNTYGYEISNDLVKQFGKYLNRYHNGIKKVYANSYTVFGLKYQYDNEETLHRFLDNLIQAIEHYPFSINLDGNELEFLIEITIGVSDPKVINNTIDELNEAENALDYALENRHSMDIFSSSFYENIEENKENLLLAKKIKKAIEHNQIILYYQPIYNNSTDTIEKYESLIRMKSDGAIIFPDKFLPIAKQINKYNILSYIVIDKAFKYFHDKECEFSINISILDIENTHFQEYLFERLKYYGISNKLVLEIVEQEGVENYNEFFEFIKKLKTHGCKIAIDDFGSGYSNYEYIINASEYIDYLKIDGSLIKNLPVDHKIQILVGSLKFLCDNLGIQTIAEYVEDEEVLKYVKSIGIDYSQGYHIGKPKENIL